MASPDRLAQLRPVFWNPERSSLTCTVCATPVDSYTRCYQCTIQARSSYTLSDIVAPITYAVTDSQAMHDLYVYKDNRYPSAVVAGAQRRLFSMLFESLSRHLECFSTLGGRELVVTTVPSSSGRAGTHPLARALEMFSSFDKTAITYVGPTSLDRSARRVLAPERFKVAPADVAKKHVLLMDDAWVTGAHLQSCGAALHAAGASFVSAVPLGRVLDRHGREAGPYLNAHRQREFDPEICPLTGTAH